ncbi:HAD family hydrolase [uncultured Methanobrevibacter sp.]|uniref:HAD family hydrolase n=1 Tax=uncultured Methanobrevibacter sp. TaxID=253161 RepID=UPI0025DADA23|nr:HAD family hydrolase [uncultured Methanobrevibacter sp.]
MTKKAIVFDNSGTLLERFRVIKDVSTCEFITNINSLDLIDSCINAALVVLQFNTSRLKDMDENMQISDFVLENDIEFEISYSSTDVSKEDIVAIFEKDNAVLKDISDTFPLLKERVPNMELCNGSAVIVDIEEEKIAYTITSAGQLFSGVKDTIAKLQDNDIDVFIASGDRSGAIKMLADITGIPKDHAFPTANTQRKAEIVGNLQDEGYKVMMVGDGPNDVLAFQQADSAVLTIEQHDGEFPEKLSDYADFVIEEISEVLEIDF